jgi:hypothetical protein
LRLSKSTWTWKKKDLLDGKVLMTNFHKSISFSESLKRLKLNNKEPLIKLMLLRVELHIPKPLLQILLLEMMTLSTEFLRAQQLS